MGRYNHIKRYSETMANYASEFYAGEPCITRNILGDGKAYYVGTEPGGTLMNQLLSAVLKDANVEDLGWSDVGTELTIREKDNKKWIFAINFNNYTCSYQVPEKYNLVLGEDSGTLKPFEIHLYSNNR